jgi:hypothetical protein
MTEANSPEPLEVLPMPPGAIELPGGPAHRSIRAMAIAALKQVLALNHPGLPFGPQVAAEEEGRLLSLNRFAIQLATGGIGADLIPVDQAPWAVASSAPQLLLAAQVDEENDVVAFNGVLTGAEFVALANAADRNGQAVLLEPSAFKGGLDRLLTLVQLLEPEAIPRLALGSLPVAGADSLASIMGRSVVAVADWLTGLIDDTLSTLGATLLPTAGADRSVVLGIIATPFPAAFRTATPAGAVDGGLAVLSIPLGLADDGSLVSGSEASFCIEQFQLLLIPTGLTSADGLLLRLVGRLNGDLLPDGITITARQGSHNQRITSTADTVLELAFPGADELIEIAISTADGPPLQLPPLQLPPLQLPPLQPPA